MKGIIKSIRVGWLYCCDNSSFMEAKLEVVEGSAVIEAYKARIPRKLIDAQDNNKNGIDLCD